ncbi:type I DNA topoisomerase [Flammeovirga kamogawensis]|uniref:DNA topoisomerase 1 n=1 Tax=Flammeovirga kamogawensis TaxID=373891 RepID=A0ABX8GWI1_9BACT|nr:type I DNA topoisomerase [Flammeovirga kamogawensis]MBB6460608.1 DNA topoisomerase-1 [Flammeovirga kamogawensis]QWG07965.1 type I DNA topoisomerase [Flammeovirga kamogawensis]TRX69773.1 type I DNA topoisomerase [Flammeovirga kamogawensis]
MTKNLLIVESPAKAKTIEKYLGEGYTVRSSYGHVRDLKKGNDAIDVDHDFIPHYEVSPDKKDVIRELKKLSKDAEMVWLATDDDREGEAISWHLKETLKLKDNDTKRIVFREITKSAIQSAIKHPRTIDYDLVNAQQARRILDRLVGFELSPVLWKKIQRGLSAGRVQSVAARLVVEREREIEAFNAKDFFKVIATFELGNNKFLEAELSTKFKTKEEANSFLQDCLGADFSITDIKTRPGKKTPAPPFTTSTLQQEASRKLGYSVASTMSIAQKLYEAGHITYMRTDSLNLSNEAIQSATEEISRVYGNDFVQERHFKTSNKGAQEAHEAIRPTNFKNHKLELSDNREARLYDLIWKRAVASQMADAKLERTTAEVTTPKRAEKFVAKGEVIKFEGFLKAYIESNDDEIDEDEDTKGMLPPLSIGQDMPLDQMNATQRFSRPPARYTEASLVKTLEEKGIGRPSTYAPTISTIQRREYVIKEARDGKERNYVKIVLKNNEVNEKQLTETYGAEKSKLFPTNMGMVVNDFLVKHFPNVVDYSFTANVEEQFDEIAHGNLEWQKMLGGFYKPFHDTVVDTEENADRAEAHAERELGIDPATGKKVITRLGRFGPIAQIGDQEDEDKKFASLRKGQYLETITLEDALELFKLPRTIGTYEDKVVVAAIGRFGPYIRHDGKFVSLGKEYAPETVELDVAIGLIEAKRKADAEKLIKTFEEEENLQLLNGRWGPYISYNKANIKIPKELKEKAKELTYEEVKKIIEEAPEPKTRGKKAAATKKEPAKKKAATKKPAAKKAPAKKKVTTRKTATKK